MPRARRRKGVPASAPGMRAAIYVRLSRETDETTSPERQRAACEALCEARGWEVVAAEEDIDVSGFSRGLDRPGLQRILTRLAELDVIVFFKIDRLARSTVRGPDLGFQDRTTPVAVQAEGWSAFFLQASAARSTGTGGGRQEAAGSPLGGRGPCGGLIGAVARFRWRARRALPSPPGRYRGCWRAAARGGRPG
ncbi:recombinase family protein [Streptomyces sp. NPDC058459]|uniref:recombinase family protein n=1 Tax=Streptomyces sp. NPDC058459 TaxID=3346508 RepID=UPI00366213B5